MFCGNQIEFTTKREDNGFFLPQLTRHENMVKAKIVSKKSKRININEAHQKLGHMGATRLYHNFSNRGYKVTGTLDCSVCQAVKLQKKPTHRERTYQTEKANELVYIGTSGPFKITKGATSSGS